ncbi:MAG: hypothetical protein B6U88_02105 [Candidatus Aenigmarchaeota archaeon ex4484_56]|nr:MAG: hypothetical protein B6U88_02105 [Candidatus Aenigmarchaeota archaeon ex4484_56]
MIGIQNLICELFKFGVNCSSLPIDKLLIEYLLVPSVVVIIGLVIIANTFTGSHTKLRNIVIITFYIIFVYSGIYGSIAPLLYTYMFYFLVVFGAFFLITRFVGLNNLIALGKIGRVLGEKRHDIIVLKSAINQKRKSIDDFEKLIDELKEKKQLSDEDAGILKIFNKEIESEIDILDNTIKRASHLIPREELIEMKKSLDRVDVAQLLVELKKSKGDVDKIKNDVNKLTKQIEDLIGRTKRAGKSSDGRSGPAS